MIILTIKLKLRFSLCSTLHLERFCLFNYLQKNIVVPQNTLLQNSLPQ